MGGGILFKGRNFKPVSDILFGVEFICAGNGDIAVNVYPAFQVSAVQKQGRQAVRMLPAKANEDVFVEGPLGQVGGKGGLAGARDAEVNVENMGVFRAEEREQEEREIKHCVWQYRDFTQFPPLSIKDYFCRIIQMYVPHFQQQNF